MFATQHTTSGTFLVFDYFESCKANRKLSGHKSMLCFSSLVINYFLFSSDKY